ncbi:MAG: hypothetical protein ABEH43_10780, partial [Flavobacteriales bacterium]
MSYKKNTKSHSVSFEYYKNYLGVYFKNDKSNINGSCGFVYIIDNQTLRQVKKIEDDGVSKSLNKHLLESIKFFFSKKDYHRIDDDIEKDKIERLSYNKELSVGIFNYKDGKFVLIQDLDDFGIDILPFDDVPITLEFNPVLFYKWFNNYYNNLIKEKIDYINEIDLNSILDSFEIDRNKGLVTIAKRVPRDGPASLLASVDINYDYDLPKDEFIEKIINDVSGGLEWSISAKTSKEKTEFVKKKESGSFLEEAEEYKNKLVDDIKKNYSEQDHRDYIKAISKRKKVDGFKVHLNNYKEWKSFMAKRGWNGFKFMF